MNKCIYFQQIACVRGLSTVQGLGVTGVLLPGLEGSRRLTVKPCFSGCLMCRGQCALWPGCDRVCGGAELSVCVCMHKFSRILALPLGRMLFAHPFHLRGYNYQCLWGFFSFEVGNMQTTVAHPGCSFRKVCLDLMLMKIWCSKFESMHHVSGFQQH